MPQKIIIFIIFRDKRLWDGGINNFSEDMKVLYGKDLKGWGLLYYKKNG